MDKETYSDTVKFIRLKSGEDLLTEAVELEAFNPDIKEHFWTLTNPLKIVYMTNPASGGMAVGLVNWVSTMFAPEQTFNIKDEDILVITSITNEMANNYYGTLDESREPASKEEVQEMLQQIMSQEDDTEWDEPPPNKKHYH
jgi:hypothetical protein